jgi:hypothetical protein
MEMLVPITFFFSVAAVMILRPISKNFGKLLEQMARDRRERGTADVDVASLRLTLEHVGKRLELMEERLDFTERLLASGDRSAKGAEDRARLMR